MSPRTIRCSPDLDQRILKATAEWGFTSASAFIRSAVERELRRRGADQPAAEERAAASFERLVVEMRRLMTGQQALFAFVDALAKVVLTCVPEPSGEIYQAAVARAKVRYDRLLKSTGSNLYGESGQAFAALTEHIER
jgi:hypothetical protein